MDVATGVPPMLLAAATAAAVAADGQTDASMSAPAPTSKRTAEEEAMACAKDWIKMSRVVSNAEQGKGKGKEGGEIEGAGAEA